MTLSALQIAILVQDFYRKYFKLEMNLSKAQKVQSRSGFFFVKANVWIMDQV